MITVRDKLVTSLTAAELNAEKMMVAHGNENQIF